MRSYYVILSNGVPVDVTNYYEQAKVRVREWYSPGSPAEIVECTPLQTSFDFLDEETTEDDAHPEPNTGYQDLNR